MVACRGKGVVIIEDGSRVEWLGTRIREDGDVPLSCESDFIAGQPPEGHHVHAPSESLVSGGGGGEGTAVGSVMS